MSRHRSPAPNESDPVTTCPECGAHVPAMASARWLAVHEVGTGTYVYPQGPDRRCLGSLLPVDLATDADASTSHPQVHTT